MAFGIFEILISIGGITLALYSYVKWSYDYWEKREVPGPKPSVPFGNFRDVFFRRKSITDVLQEFYDTYKNEPFFGFFVGRVPVFVPTDPDLLKDLLIKDSDVFSNRGRQVNEDVDPLTASVANLSGHRWKVLRSKLSPVFTTAKMKHMFNLMMKCSENLESYLNDQVAKNEQIDCCELAARYSTDVISCCTLGIETQALTDDDDVFRNIGRKHSTPSFVNNMKRLMREVAPRLFSFLRISILQPDVSKIFINTMKQTIELRKKEIIVRNDFVDTLMNLSKDSAVDGFEWTDNLLAAQGFAFFIGGFETSPTAISFALWELARAPEVQERLRQEVRTFYIKNDGKIIYEDINEMKYLDMVVKETLRKHTPTSMIGRRAMRDYKIPRSNVVLQAGQFVHIPLHSLHRDPKYYPKPDVFEPERFTDEAIKARHPMVYLPFGAGPRGCIATRFAYYQVKVALIKVMTNFRVHLTEKSNDTYVVDPDSTFLALVGGIVLKFERISA